MVQYIGRFLHDNDTHEFGWSGSKISAGFKGKKIGAVLQSSFAEDYINVYIDGERTSTLKIGNTKERYVLADNLTDDIHSVQIEKCTEGMETTITYFEFDYFDGAPYLMPTRKQKSIMFIGDSVTAGYGVLGAESGFRLSEENVAMSYAGYTVDALNADGIYIAISGQGMAQSISGTNSPVMKDYFSLTVPQKGIDASNQYNLQRENPDVIVVNLGTNDFASQVDEQYFETQYSDFLTSLRTIYPDSSIVCVAGPHKVGLLAKTHIQSIVEAHKSCGEEHIYFKELSPAEGLGADGHPSSSEQEVAGNELVAFIRCSLEPFFAIHHKK